MIKLKTKGETTISLNEKEMVSFRKFIKKYKGCYISLDKNILSAIGEPNDNYVVYTK